MNANPTSNQPNWHVNILTLFPDMFPGTLGQSVPGKALHDRKWSFDTINIRDFSQNNYRSVDDTPFGGGAGMVMRPDIIESAYRSIKNPGKSIYLSPRGKPLDHDKSKELAKTPILTLLCGRYEGVDQRVLDACDFEEISIGDFVLFGGEVAAMALMESCIRLLPDIVGNDDSTQDESFSNGLLEYPQYTRPATWHSTDGTVYEVPDILRSGRHKDIEEWRRKKSLHLTKINRPDLLKNEEKT